ncbi:MAG: HAD-IA family hydrolase [Succinatimonas hippei]|nr:HAD-IA family hydrolase [Succinatimonas hippei]
MIFFKSIRKVRAISFDLDDTLYDNQPVITSAEKRFSLYLKNHFALPDVVADPVFWRTYSDDCIRRYPQLDNDVTRLREVMLVRALKDLGHPIDEGMAKQLTAYFIKIRSQIVVPKSSFELLSELHARYPMACLSNGNSDINQDGLAGYFDYDLRPSVDGCRCKPNQDLFVHFARLAGVKPCEVLHVGDDPFTDVYGAVAAGCQCAWLERGIAGKTSGTDCLRILPEVQLSSLEELRQLLF